MNYTEFSLFHKKGLLFFFFMSGTYEAVKYDILITINEWLGEDATISYDIDY